MKLGNPATGQDFWGRERELRDIWGYLAKEHLQFPGVRRLGKSSILLRLEEQAANQGVLGKSLDVSAIHTATDFVRKLDQSFSTKGIVAFFKKHSQTSAAWLARIQSVKGTLPESLGGGGLEIQLAAGAQTKWLDQAQALEQRLRSQALLILVDEFPVMLANILQRDRHEAELLLAWLRIWRQNRANNCRFVFTGSIGLQSLLERHGLATHMNDCHPYALGPFSQHEAQAMWVHFAQQKGWHSPAAVVQHALARIGWLSPFFVCLMLDESCKAATERLQEQPAGAAHPAGEPATLLEDDVNAAYENLLAQRARFYHWEQRLREAMPPDAFKFTQTLLTHLSRAQEGLTLRQLSARMQKLQTDPDLRAEQIQNTLTLLTDEGYTTPTNADKRVQFRSFLLRDWWSRNHV